jgi:hypothetical protein
VLPAGSVARTSNVCVPDARPVYSCGEEHAVKAPASTRHAKPDPASLELKVKVALVAFVGSDGPESTVVSGGVVSIVQVQVAGVGSVFPSESVARTAKV